MEVTENIKVLSLGEQIRRGIFRTLPVALALDVGKTWTNTFALIPDKHRGYIRGFY